MTYMLATSLPVAQWLERPTGVRKVMRSIPVGDSDFFFVPRSRHAEYSIFSYPYEQFLDFLTRPQSSLTRIKKWSIVPDQLKTMKFKQ